MNKYTISTTIKSSLVSHKGIKFAYIEIMTPDVTKPQEMLVSMEIDSLNWREAIGTFRVHMKKLIDAISLGSGAATTWYESNYLVEKKGEDIVYVSIYTKSRDARLPVSNQIKEDIEKIYLNLKNNDTSFNLLRHAIAIKDGKLGLMLALFGTENVAGRIPTEPGELGYAKTDKTKLKAIIGRLLFKQYFSDRKILGERSIRTALAHGHEFELDGDDMNDGRKVLLATINQIRRENGIERDLDSSHRFEDYVQGGYAFKVTGEKVNLFRLIEKILKYRAEDLGYELTGLPDDF